MLVRAVPWSRRSLTGPGTKSGHERRGWARAIIYHRALSRHYYLQHNSADCAAGQRRLAQIWWDLDACRKSASQSSAIVTSSVLLGAYKYFLATLGLIFYAVPRSTFTSLRHNTAMRKRQVKHSYCWLYFPTLHPERGFRAP